MKKNNRTLSFIVPVYNVAPYLRKCVFSLVHQDFKNYEVIVVDDGSTDESPQICDELASSNELAYERVSELGKPLIRVIHQKNAGLSAARNAGLKVAKGKYVCFVDSDDYWEENVLGGLMEQVERDRLDVLRFDYQNVRLVKDERVNGLTDERRYEVFQPNKTPRYIDAKSDVVDGETYLNTRMGYACYAVMYIIKRSLLVKDDGMKGLMDECFFKEGIHFEDVDWLPRMMLRAKRVNSATTVVYNYLVRQGSITKTQGDKDKVRRNIDDSLLTIDRYRQYREWYSNCIWLYNMQSSMVAGVLTTVAMEFYEERKKYIGQLKDMKVFPLRIAGQGKTYKRRAILINLLGTQMYCALVKIKELVS